MLTIDQLSTVEALLMSKSHPMWGEFMPLAGLIAAVQTHKTELIQAANADPAKRTRPALAAVPPPPAEPDKQSTPPQSAA